MHNGNKYIYTKNVQGDVTGIIDYLSMEVIAQYRYDAWGKLLSVRDAAGVDVSANANHIANINPLRYRGYYYDTETGLYYLNSRYYDPETGRFLNSDGLIDNRGVTFQNMYTYCVGNPIMYIDSAGTCVTAWEKGYRGSCPGINSPDCYDNYDRALIGKGRPDTEPVPKVTSPVNHSDYRNDAPSAAYGTLRGGGTRTHKGVDYYPSDSIDNSKYGSDGTPKNIYAMSDGVVVQYMSNFYAGTSAVVINHGDFYALYGEISTGLRKGDKVSQGDNIGVMAISWDSTLMLHLEIFEGGYGGYSRNNPFRVDPTYTYDLPNW